MTADQIKSVVITGRRWHDSNGGTYFSAVGIVDGMERVSIPFEYGYGDHYVEAIITKLTGDGWIPTRDLYGNGLRSMPGRHFHDLGIKLHYSASDVARKRDL